jgi:starch-binding outer membrane protein, SusD/RagB family
MKKKIFIKIFIALIAVTGFTSCNDLFNVPNIQKNPNAPLDAPLPIILAGAELGVAQMHEDTDVRIAMMWAGQLAGLSRQHAGFELYSVSSGTFDNSWFNLYYVGAQVRIVQKKATATTNNVALGAAQVMEALIIAKATALYGDVPYTEAWDEVKFPTPKYDTQASIYTALVALLNTAYANLTAPATGTLDGDFLAGGSGAKWAKAAKTLQARLYLHLKDYPNAIAASNLGIASAADDMLVPHGTAQTIDNNMNFDFFANSRPGDTGFDAPAYLPVHMQTRFDGGTANTAGKAVRNSKTDDTALYNHFMQIGVATADGLDPNIVDGMFIDAAPHPVLTYYENALIRAEAQARLAAGGAADAAAVISLNVVRAGLAAGYIGGQTIIDDYQDLGIKADPYLVTDFSAAGAAFQTGKTAQYNLIYEILTTKFEVMLAEYESFNDLRRTQVALPKVTLPVPIQNQFTEYPARFLYSQNEINTNPNTPKGNTVFTKMTIFQ